MSSCPTLTPLQTAGIVLAGGCTGVLAAFAVSTAAQAGQSADDGYLPVGTDSQATSPGSGVPPTGQEPLPQAPQAAPDGQTLGGGDPFSGGGGAPDTRSGAS